MMNRLPKYIINWHYYQTPNVSLPLSRVCTTMHPENGPYNKINETNLTHILLPVNTQ